MSRLWIVKWNRQSTFSSSGNWIKFFEDGVEERCGGDWFSSNAASLKAFTEITPGDLVLAYQTDQQAAIGLCRVTRTHHVREGVELYCEPIRAFDSPVKLHALKRQLPDLGRVRALRRGLVQTYYATSPPEAKTLLRACGVHASPKYLERVATKRESLPFGLPEQNRKVELAAVRHVRQHYRRKGWTVRSVERLNLGWDLTCEKGGREEHVEVKGVRQAWPAFLLTSNERRRADDDPRFVLCVVTEATRTTAALHRWTGKQVGEIFEFEPVAYRASLLDPANVSALSPYLTSGAIPVRSRETTRGN